MRYYNPIYGQCPYNVSPSIQMCQQFIPSCHYQCMNNYISPYDPKYKEVAKKINVTKENYMEVNLMLQRKEAVIIQSISEDVPLEFVYHWKSYIDTYELPLPHIIQFHDKVNLTEWFVLESHHDGKYERFVYLADRDYLDWDIITTSYNFYNYPNLLDKYKNKINWDLAIANSSIPVEYLKKDMSIEDIRKAFERKQEVSRYYCN